MASPKTTISFSIALLATAALLSAATAARNLQGAAVNPFCSDADDKVLCTQMVKGAKTWPEAMTNSLKDALEKAKAGKHIIDGLGSLLSGDLLPQSKESIDATCRETYDNIIDNIERCIGFVTNDPESSLKVFLSAISFTECCDGLNEFGVSGAEATDFSNEILKLDSALLAIADARR